MAKVIKQNDFMATLLQEADAHSAHKPHDVDKSSSLLEPHTARIHMRLPARLKKDMEDLARIMGMRDGITQLIIETMTREVESNADVLNTVREKRKASAIRTDAS